MKKAERIIISTLLIYTFINLVVLLLASSSGEYRLEYFYPIYYHFSDSIFEVYDYTEFFVYVGGVWLIYFLYKFLNK